jgi:hypothetical protein
MIKYILGLIALSLGDIFKKHPWALWILKPNDTKWALIGKGSKRRLKLYQKILNADGLETLICGIGITPVYTPTEKNNV